MGNKMVRKYTLTNTKIYDYIVPTRDEDGSDDLENVGVGHIQLLREEEDGRNHQHLEIKLRSGSHCIIKIYTEDKTGSPRQEYITGGPAI